jgi:CubicO group peptidase (beta-lactamase class C family)
MQVFAQSVETTPGTVWVFASAPVDLLSYVIEDVTGRTLGDFFNDEIGSAIGTSRVTFPSFGGHSGGSGGPGGGGPIFHSRSCPCGLSVAPSWRLGAQRQCGAGDRAEQVVQFTQWVPFLENTKWHEPNFAFGPKANDYYGYLFWTNRTQ